MDAIREKLIARARANATRMAELHPRWQGMGRAYCLLDGTPIAAPYCGGPPDTWDPAPDTPYLTAHYDYATGESAVFELAQATVMP